MTGRIRASDIEELKSRVNIADVIGEVVTLRQGGVGALKGLCPFHEEKSPSFNVRPLQGFYHCFGCGEGGDVFKFVQRHDSLGFTEAVERVAARVGFQLHYEEGTADPDSAKRTRLLEANAAAQRFYAAQLLTSEGEPGRAFLKGRGFDRAAAEQFGIGYAPRGWDHLARELSSQGFQELELLASGLVSKGDRGLYDRFRGRVIWPIRDASGQVLGFGARKLFDDDQGPKYLNTPETAVYHKSQVLYGLDLARRSIAKERQVVVVEGYTDVMACHLAGVTTAVATCGTAFGENHIKLLNRLLGEGGAAVIFTFDPDAAGEKAAMRAFNDSSKMGAQSYIAVAPAGLDPCDLRLQRGDEAVRALVTERRPLLEFALKYRIAEFDTASVEGRLAAARAALQTLAGVADAAVKRSYLRELSVWLSLDFNELVGLLAAEEQRARKQGLGAMRVETSIAKPAEHDFDGTEGQEPSGVSAEMIPLPDLKDPAQAAEVSLLQVLLQVSLAMQDEQLDRLRAGALSQPALIAIFEAWRAAPDSLDALVTQLPSQLHPLVRWLAASPLPAADEAGLQRFARGVVSGSLARAINREKAVLMGRLAAMAQESSSQAYSELQEKLRLLENERRALVESR